MSLVRLALPLAGLVLAAVPFAHRQPQQTRVTLYLSTDCPVAARYTPRLNALVAEFAPRGVEFEAVFPNEGESRSGVGRYVAERGYTFPWKLDVGGDRAKADGVETLPVALVHGPSGELLYRGAIDDNKIDELAKRPYLANALEAALAGRKPEVAETEPFGCLLMAGEPVPATERVTYAEHVAPILNRACAPCHHPGDVGPFSIVGYENARKWARMIARVTEQRVMPPWPADDTGPEFKGDNRLSEREIELLRRWAEGGAPRGDQGLEPSEPVFDKEWALGEPDLVLEMPQEHELAAEGRDEYWHFVLKPEIEEPVWVQAIDVKPGNRRIVHHVIAFIDENGASERRIEPGALGYETFGGPGFVPDNALGGWAPGLRAMRSRPGTGILLKPGARVVMQVHYNKSGKPERDRTKMGLYLAKEPVDQPLGVAWLANPFIRIPAGEAKSVHKFEFPLRRAATVHALMPHMHLLGRTMKAEAILPDGQRLTLIHVPDWNFKWQLSYQLAEPLTLPAGTRVVLEALYDNSDGNPNNPFSPPQEVRWGEETKDEMMLLVAWFGPG